MYTRLESFYASRLERLREIDSGLDFSQIDPTPVYDGPFMTKSRTPIMIIGEAPGANEVMQKMPFVGMAGKNLSQLITHAGLSRETDFLITNAFPFRTFQEGSSGIKNRTPSIRELKAGAELLREELMIVRPRMILVLGGSAKKAFLKIADRALTDGILEMENHTYEKVRTGMGFETVIGLSFHPSPLVFNMPNKRAQLLQFFSRLKQYGL